MSVFQRNGHWYLSVTVNGKRIRKAIKEARTRTQAERAERISRDEIYENRFGIGGQRNFADFIEKSYKPYAKEHKKGYNVELSIIKALLEKFGKLKLCEITPEAVEKFKRERASEVTSRGKVRAKTTVNRDIAVLSAVFNLAKDFGEIKSNPTENVKYYTQLPSRERILSDVEERILFKHIRADVKFSRQVKILLYTGIWKNLMVHSLRHTFSTRADKFGVGAFARKALLGHSKLTMTDRYTHISNETLTDSLENFEQFVAERDAELKTEFKSNKA